MKNINLINNFNREYDKCNLFIDAIPLMRKKLSNTEFVFFISLMEFTQIEDCTIRSSNHRNSHIIDMKEMSELLDMDYSSVRRIVSSLQKNELLKHCKTSDIIPESDTKMKYVYLVNPYVFCNGDIVNINIINMFIDSEWAKIFETENENISRNSTLYKIWKTNVFIKDNYTCQCCGSKLKLEAHHIDSFSSNPDKRVDINNGITLCESCHSSKISGSFHNLYGTHNNTKEQLDEYITNKRKQSNHPIKPWF